MSEIFSVSTIAYDGYDLEVALEELSRIGCKYVELDSIEGLFEHVKPENFQDENFMAKINAVMRKCNLFSSAFSGHMDLSKEGVVPFFEKKMRFAKSVGAKVINTFSGPRERIDIFYKNIKELDRLARQMDLIIALETHGDIISDKSSIEVIEKINSDNIKVNYDFVNTFHATKGKIDLEEDFKSMLPYVVHLHLKDTVLEKDTWYFPQIGEGIMDYQGIFRILKQSNKEISMSIELPLRLEMKEGKVRVPKKTKTPLKIDQINQIIKGSLSYVTNLWESI